MKWDNWIRHSFQQSDNQMLYASFKTFGHFRTNLSTLFSTLCNISPWKGTSCWGHVPMIFLGGGHAPDLFVGGTPGIFIGGSCPFDISDSSFWSLEAHVCIFLLTADFKNTTQILTVYGTCRWTCLRVWGRFTLGIILTYVWYAPSWPLVWFVVNLKTIIKNFSNTPMVIPMVTPPILYLA